MVTAQSTVANGNAGRGTIQIEAGALKGRCIIADDAVGYDKLRVEGINTSA